MFKKPIVQFTIGIILFLVLAWIFTDILVYFILAIIISSILKPIVNYISNTQVYHIRIPRVLAVIMSFIIFIAFIYLFIILFIPVVSDQVSILTGLEYNRVIEKISIPITRVEEFMINYGLTSQEPGFIVEDIEGGIQQLLQSSLADLLNSILSVTGNFFIGFIAVVFITFMLLSETALLRKGIISMIPNRYFEVTVSALTKIERLFSKYLLGLLLQMLAIFTIAAVGLSILGIKYALTIALFAAVANVIPYLGPLLGATFGIVVGISTTLGIFTMQEYVILIIKIGSVFGVVQLMDNLIFQPWIFSKSVRAHPLEIFVIIFAGATVGKLLAGSIIGGMIGMIVAIPVYTIIKVTSLELYKGYRQYKIFRI